MPKKQDISTPKKKSTKYQPKSAAKQPPANDVPTQSTPVQAQVDPQQKYTPVK